MYLIFFIFLTPKTLLGVTFLENNLFLILVIFKINIIYKLGKCKFYIC